MTTCPGAPSLPLSQPICPPTGGCGALGEAAGSLTNNDGLLTQLCYRLMVQTHPSGGVESV